MKCKVCGKSLYEQISFFNLFNTNYTIHDRCKKKLVKKTEEVYLPFENSFLVFQGIFDISDLFDENYMFYKYVGLYLYQHLENTNWSIILFYEKGMNYAALKLVHYLSRSGVILITVMYRDIYDVEEILLKKI